MKNYQQIPSTAIDSITIDSDTNQVVVKYKSSEKSYTYSTENAVEFDTQLLNEFDSEDVSVGRFINQNVSSGNLQLIQE
jgi:ATP-dependent Zn protease